MTAPTKTTDFAGFLNPVQAAPIFERAYRQSVVQQLVGKVPVGPSGTSIPVVTGRMAAGWVAEGAPKPVSKAALSLKTMSLKKIAAIAVVSAEVVRANPGGYMDLIRPQIAEAMALAFDSAALHGTSSPFTTNVDQTANAVEDPGAAPAWTAVYDDLNGALGLLVNAGYIPNGWAFDLRFEPIVNGAKDTAGRPLFIDAVYTDQSPIINGRIFGRKASMGFGIGSTDGKTMGYLGDWSQAAWGSPGGISYDVSTEASVTLNGTLTSLWENNLVAVRAEAEFAFLVNDTNAFVKIKNGT